MNSFKVGLELKKLVYKKKLGQGEWLYVSAESKKEASGKKEIVDLLKEESSWESLYRLKLAGETEESFCKERFHFNRTFINSPFISFDLSSN